MLFDIYLCEFLDLVINSHVKFKHIIWFNLITLFNYDARIIVLSVGNSIECIDTVDTLRFNAIECILNTNLVANVWILESLYSNDHIVDKFLNVLS